MSLLQLYALMAWTGTNLPSPSYQQLGVMGNIATGRSWMIKTVF